MIITKEEQWELLRKYFAEGHNIDEASGFVDGINETINFINEKIAKDEQTTQNRILYQE